MPTPHRRCFLTVVGFALLSIMAAVSGAQQPERGVTVAAAPVRLYADSNRTPLATLSPGTSVQILGQEGDWLRISFRDKSYGDRVGFVRAEHVRTVRQNQPVTSAPEVRSQPNGGTASPAAAVMPATSTMSEGARATSSVTAQQPRQFPNAQLTVAEGQKTKQVDVTINYAGDAFQLLEKNTRKPMKEFPYKSFASGEYSYSKSPRWKSGVFLSPFLFLSSGKKHWLLVKTADDYAMLRLDKNNYKLIIAEWEIRTGLKVEAQGENK